jgi:hypothetical protein
MDNMKKMTLQQAESFVEQHPDAEWNGWDIHLFIEDDVAQYSSQGVFRNGKWYRVKVIAVNEKGEYVVGNNLTRLAQTTRN